MSLLTTVLAKPPKKATGAAAPFDLSSVPGLQFGAEAWREPYSADAAVDTITDLSSNGADATQATTNAKPTFKTNVLNGRAVYRFDGGDFVRQDPLSTTTQPFTVFVVVKLSSATAMVLDGISSPRVLLYADGANWNIYNGAFLAGAAVDTTAFRIMVGLFNGASSKLWKTGGTPATGNPSTGGYAGFTIGADVADGTLLTGDIAALALYTNLSLANTNVVGAGLAATYGLTWTTAT